MSHRPVSRPMRIVAKKLLRTLKNPGFSKETAFLAKRLVLYLLLLRLRFRLVQHTSLKRKRRVLKHPLTGNDKRPLNRILLKPENLREAKSLEHLDGEDLFDPCFESHELDRLARTHIDYPDAAVQIGA